MFFPGITAAIKERVAGVRFVTDTKTNSRSSRRSHMNHRHARGKKSARLCVTDVVLVIGVKPRSTVYCHTDSMSYVLKTAVLVLARRVTSDFPVNDQSSFWLRVTILRQRHRRQPRRRSTDSLTVEPSTRNVTSSTVVRHQRDASISSLCHTFRPCCQISVKQVGAAADDDCCSCYAHSQMFSSTTRNRSRALQALKP